jgi:hypothetical protein
MDRPRSPHELGETFLASVRDRDWAALAATFAPDASFQAVVDNADNPFRDRTGGEAAAAQVARWFDDGDIHELVAGGVEELADRVHVWYRVHNHEPGGWYLVEQHVFAEPSPGGDGFRRVVLACSGFRPAAPLPGAGTASGAGASGRR